MKIELNSNRWAGAFAIAAGVAVALLIPHQVELSRLPGSYVGPRYVPYFVCAIMILLGVTLVALSFVRKTKAVVTVNLSKEIRVFLFFGLLVLYAVAIPLVGFLISTVVFCGAALLFIGSRRWIHYLIMMGILLAIYALFAFVLQVDLP